MHIVSDVSDNGRAKAITEDNLEVHIANSTTFINELTTNSTFITNINGDVLPLTTKGDILAFDTAANRLPVGNDGYVLTADSTEALGVKWAAIGGGGGGTSSGKPISFQRVPAATIVMNGYIDREAMFYNHGSSTDRVSLQDTTGFIQSRDVDTDTGWGSGDTTIGGYTLIGSYLYLLAVENGGAGISVYRYDASDLSSGGTLMTISGATLAQQNFMLMTSNGTHLFINNQNGDSANSRIISKFSISGTTLTFVSSVTCGGTNSYFQTAFAVDSSENYYGTDGMIIYQYDNTGTLIYTSGSTASSTSDIEIILNWGNTLYSSTSTGNYSSKLYLPDTDLASSSSEQHVVGAMNNNLVKTYFNIQLPFLLWTGSTNGALTTNFANWVNSSSNVSPLPMGAMVPFTGTGVDSIYLNYPFVNTNTGSQFLGFNDTNIIIMDWWALLPASGTGDVNMGFGYDSAPSLPFTGAWNDTAGNGSAVKFAQKSTGELMAVITTEGVGVSSTDITSGITVTDWNNYRIELHLGTDAKFYVNGVLKATLSGANLYTGTNPVELGFGRSDTSLFTITAPTLSLQMNP